MGVVIAEVSVNLAALIDGRVADVKVHVGSEVRQGELVATLEARSVRQELTIAEAELLSARAEQSVARVALEQAKERLQRRDTSQQVLTGAISEEELSTARYEQRMAAAQLEVASSKVQEREARVAQLSQRVAETFIRAPFDGVIASRFIHPGALVQAGTPLIHLVRRGAPQARFAIPASQVRRVSVGTAVQVTVPEQGLVLQGKVTQVAPEVDVASLMVFALTSLELEGQQFALPAGSVVRVSLVEGERLGHADARVRSEPHNP
ncbi:efflux RND transporter periplasmic adaptor subunit [Myxococcus sp. QH3KD-4-1]|nr:efflux RND transporter periplasmic adaptor subunit [Myxococcus qinghaiensis]